LNLQEFEDLTFGSDDEEVKRKKLKVKKGSSWRRGTDSGKVARSVQQGHEELNVSCVLGRSERILSSTFLSLKLSASPLDFLLSSSQSLR